MIKPTTGISITVGTIVLLLGGAVSWAQLGLPRPALHSELRSYIQEDRARDAETIDRDLTVIKRDYYEVRRAQAEYAAPEVPDWLIDKQVDLEHQIHDLEAQRDKLTKGE